MASESNANSSDLEAARVASTRLTAGDRAPEIRLGTQPEYARLPPRAARIRSPLNGPSSAVVGAFGPEMWNGLLDRVLDLTAARAAFVMESTGLLVAARRTDEIPEIESLGAVLASTVDQALRMAVPEHPIRALAVELPTGWLLGIRVQTASAEQCTLGLLAPRPLSKGDRAAIETLFVTVTQ